MSFATKFANLSQRLVSKFGDGATVVIERDLSTLDVDFATDRPIGPDVRRFTVPAVMPMVTIVNAAGTRVQTQGGVVIVAANDLIAQGAKEVLPTDIIEIAGVKHRVRPPVVVTRGAAGTIPIAYRIEVGQ